jgi:hypothetical protein
MIALFFLFVAELLVFAFIWHNGSPRSERKHEIEKLDRSVLCSDRSSSSQTPPPAAEERSEKERPL